MRLDDIKKLHDLNVELLHSNLMALNRIKEYCKCNGIPSPVMDDALDYNIQQLREIREALNRFVESLPPELDTQFRHHDDWTV